MRGAERMTINLICHAHVWEKNKYGYMIFKYIITGIYLNDVCCVQIVRGVQIIASMVY